MVNYNSDIVEIRLLDRNFTLYFKAKGRLKDMKDMQRLSNELKSKGADILKDDVDWFE